MSGLEALSLACNVMTVITFALDTAKVCRTIRKSGSSDPDLEQNTSQRKQIFNDVEQVLKRDPTQPTDAEKRLRKLATECMGYAKDIQVELDYTSGQSGGRLAAARSTFRTVRRKRHIDDYTQRLEAAKSTLDSALLAEIFSELMQSKGSKGSIYDKLNKQQQYLLDNNHQTRELLVGFRASEEAQAYEKLLRSLKYDQMNSRKTNITHRHESTFEWVFSEESPKSNPGVAHSSDSTAVVVASSSVSTSTTPQRQSERDLQQKRKSCSLGQWLQEDSRSLYWVNGKPGSGKSTFMKFIENDQRTKKALQIWQPKCKIISHFLWKPGTEDQQSYKGMLCSLLYQALCDERDIALQILRDTPGLVYRDSIADWDTEDLRGLLYGVFRCSSSAYLILLDGLDELSKSDRGLNKLFPLLESLIAMDCIKLCVSSRPQRPFTDKFESSPSLRMQDLTQGDIAKYTLDFLGELQLQPNDKLYGPISSTVVYRSEGVFIWVYVVLQSVKHGIEQYNETWHDIYARILRLKPDLMKLYRDMWSRSGEQDEKYIKKAVRYFHFIRTAPLQDRSIAGLALIADEDVLDAITCPDKIPWVDKWVEMCQHTFITLAPVSAGLLEVMDLKGQVRPEHRVLASESCSGLRSWLSSPVDFVHRSAEDFIDSPEGKQLFEKYTLGPEDSLSLRIKAQLALRSVGCNLLDPLFFIRQSLFQFYLRVKNANKAPQPPGEILSLIHRCATNESLGLVRAPYSINHEDFFLLGASCDQLYEYITGFLEPRGDYNLTTLNHILIGACDRRTWPGYESHSDTTRYLFIRDLLQRQSQLFPKDSRTSKTGDTSEGIMLAWRCFLVHELSVIRRFLDADGEIVKEILEMFIGCGAMLESPRSKYLIEVRCDTLQMKVMKIVDDVGVALGYKFPGHHFRTRWDSVVYIEVNDAFLLARLSERISGTSELFSTETKNASMYPILAENGRGDRDIVTFFHITVPEDDQPSFKDWIFGECLRSGQTRFPDQQPSFLQTVVVGEFETAAQALEKIGYGLPEVNNSFKCLHDWFGPWLVEKY